MVFVGAAAAVLGCSHVSPHEDLDAAPHEALLPDTGFRDAGADDASAYNCFAAPPDQRCTFNFPTTPGDPTEGTLTVEFTSSRLGGKYGPRNVGAVWVEDTQGHYVRTLELWGGPENRTSVTSWYANACLTDPTLASPDVLTSATLPGPATHKAHWDTRTFRGKLVADGVYRLSIQLTENQIFPEGPQLTVEFEKRRDRWTLSPAAPRGFGSVALEYVPKN
jgi:hypothetical protein